MINDNDNTADVGKAKTDAYALSDQAAGASHSKEAKVTNGATECKDQPSADCAVEINFNDVENDPEFEDPTIPRKYKYADRCALSSAGVIAGGSLYLIRISEHLYPLLLSLPQSVGLLQEDPIIILLFYRQKEMFLLLYRHQK